ncbi:cell division FtsA domain-containing protein [Thermovibrio sp.]
MKEKDILAIDLGTESVRVSLTSIKGNKKYAKTVKVPSRGIRSGNIVNPSSAEDSLISALNRLRIEIGTSLPNEAYIVVPGGRILSYEVEARIVFPSMKVINYNDVNEVKNKIKSELRRMKGIGINKYNILHIIPQEFIVGSVEGIQNPVGHSGKELILRAFVVLVARDHWSTIDNLVRKVGLRLKGGVLQTLASYYALKDENTYFNNVLFMYMGAGSTEFLYFREDAPIFFKQEPFGAEDLIDFIAQSLKVSKTEAERLFKEYGSAYAFRVSKKETITVNYGIKVKSYPKILIPALVQFKLKKLFEGVKTTLNKEDPSYLIHLNRVYLTGGLANLKDIGIFLEKVFKTPAEVVPSVSPIDGVANYVLSLEEKKRFADVKEDLKGASGGLFSFIRRFIEHYI